VVESFGCLYPTTPEAKTGLDFTIISIGVIDISLQDNLAS
jgi:hypothetical protein